MLSRLFAFSLGCLFVITGLILAQWFFGTSEVSQHQASIKDEISQSYYDNESEKFGWQFLPNVKSHVVRRMDNEIVYDITIKTDPYGRRIVREDYSPSHKMEKEDFLILLGGSFIVGEGLKDQDTLDYKLTQHMPQFQSYNYGVNGYGLGNVMAQAQYVDFKSQVSQKKGLILYLFPSFHIDRLVGGLQSIDYIGGIPYYYLEND